MLQINAVLLQTPLLRIGPVNIINIINILINKLYFILIGDKLIGSTTKEYTDPFLKKSC